MGRQHSSGVKKPIVGGPYVINIRDKLSFTDFVNFFCDSHNSRNTQYIFDRYSLHTLSYLYSSDLAIRRKIQIRVFTFVTLKNTLEFFTYYLVTQYHFFYIRTHVILLLFKRNVYQQGENPGPYL